ncbi:MAG TPA: IS110 family transposase [Candidatus Obscuribacterales bacterium]
MGRSTTSKSRITGSRIADIGPVTAKAVFAGIDFHKRFSVITLGNKEGAVLSQHKLVNGEDDVARFFLEHGPLICAIENCRGNEWFVDLVKKCGSEVRVGNTRVIRLIADSAKKNDKIDSKFLMDLVARNYLPVCYQPTKNERVLREKLRWRTKLMRSRTQYKNVAHAILDKENKGALLSSAMGRNWLQEQSRLSPERHQQLQECLGIVDFFEEHMGDADRALLQIAKEDPDIQRLKTIPGVGDISALMLLAELGDINRFKSARHVAGYIGLVPRLYASSDTIRLGRITKQGPGLLRRILVQDAWMAVRISKPFRLRYSAILKRRGKRAAIVAIARTIAEIAFHVLRDKTEFDEKKMTLG